MGENERFFERKEIDKQRRDECFAGGIRFHSHRIADGEFRFHALRVFAAGNKLFFPFLPLRDFATRNVFHEVYRSRFLVEINQTILVVGQRDEKYRLHYEVRANRFLSHAPSVPLSPGT